jgi:hypothetical protein
MDWKIEKRRVECRQCERAFEEGERHVSPLAIGEAGLSRADRCLDCWRARDEEPAESSEEQRLFWWFTRHQADRKKSVQLDLETLERLFLELEGHEERAVRELRYLLCLLLMRKRRLKVERVDRDREGDAFVVKRPRREERYRVFVFDFAPERLDELRTQLQAIFDGAEPEAADLTGAASGDPDPVGEDLDAGDSEPDPLDDAPARDGPEGASSAGSGAGVQAADAAPSTVA